MPVANGRAIRFICSASDTIFISRSLIALAVAVTGLFSTKVLGNGPDIVRRRVDIFSLGRGGDMRARAEGLFQSEVGTDDQIWRHRRRRVVLPLRRETKGDFITRNGPRAWRPVIFKSISTGRV